MKNRFKVLLLMFLIVVLGCFTSVFADTNQSAKTGKNVKYINNTQLFDNVINSQNTTWNQQDKGTDVNLSNNNLTAQVIGGQSSGAVRTTHFKTSGKWYWEITLGDYTTCGYFNGSVGIGIANSKFNINTSGRDSANQVAFYADKNLKNPSNITTRIYPINSNYPNNYGELYTKGDTIGIALDLDNKSIKFSVNGKWYGNVSIPSWSDYFPIIWSGSSMNSERQSVTANFGAAKFKNTLPEGYLPFDYTTINLNKAYDSINIGQADNLVATVNPSNVGVTWGSSDNSIATVDANGKVTGVKPGTVTITATTTDGKTATCTVSVKSQEVTKIKLILYMNNSTIRKFDLTQDEFNDFMNWYTNMNEGIEGTIPYYIFSIPAQGNTPAEKHCVPFAKIESFEFE